MPQSQSRNAPTAKSQRTHILEHRGRNASLLDGMPQFRDSQFLGKNYVFQYYLYSYNIKITIYLL